MADIMSTPEIVHAGRHLFSDSINSSGYWNQGYRCLVGTTAGNIYVGLALVPQEDEIEVYASWTNTLNGAKINCFYNSKMVSAEKLDGANYAGAKIATFNYNQKFNSKSTLELMFSTNETLTTADRDMYGYKAIIIPILAFDNIVMSGTSGNEDVTDTIQLYNGSYGTGYLRVYGSNGKLGQILSQGVNSNLGMTNSYSIDKSLVETGEDNVNVGSTKEVAKYLFDYSFDNYIPATAMYQQLYHTVTFSLEGFSKYGTIKDIYYYYDNGDSQLTAYYGIRLRSDAKALLADSTTANLKQINSKLTDFYTIAQPLMYWSSAVERDKNPVLSFRVPFTLRSDPSTHPVISNVIFRKFDDRDNHHNMLLCSKARAAEFLTVTFDAEWSKGNCNANIYLGDTLVKTAQVAGSGTNQIKVGPFTSCPIVQNLASAISIKLNDTRGLQSDQVESEAIYLNSLGTTSIGSTITVHSYAPVSGSVTVSRVTSAGITDSFEGTYLKAVAQVIGFSADKAGSTNESFYLTANLYSHTLANSDSETVIPLGTDNISNGETFTKQESGYDITQTYIIRLEVADKFGYTFSTEVLLASGEVFMDFRAGGHGLGIGMRAANENEVNIKWDTNILGNLYVGGDVTGVDSGNVSYAGSLPGSTVKAALDAVAAQIGNGDESFDASDILYLPGDASTTVKDKLDSMDTDIGNAKTTAANAVEVANSAVNSFNGFEYSNTPQQTYDDCGCYWGVKIPLSNGYHLVVANIYGEKTASTKGAFSIYSLLSPFTLSTSMNIVGNVSYGDGIQYAVYNPNKNTTCYPCSTSTIASGKTAYYDVTVFSIVKD